MPTIDGHHAQNRSVVAWPLAVKLGPRVQDQQAIDETFADLSCKAGSMLFS